MDEELQQWLKDTAMRGGEFVEREAPLLAEEIVAWTFWGGVAMVVTGLVIILCLLAVGLYFYHTSDEGDRGLVWWLILCLCVFPTILVLVGIADIVKVTVAPRMVIVEKLTG